MMKLELRGPQAVQRIKNEKRKQKEQEKKLRKFVKII